MKDYRIDGPPEAQQLVRDHPACETAPNGTGSRCSCTSDCANYWLRAHGFKAEADPEPEPGAPTPKAGIAEVFAVPQPTSKRWRFRR